MFVNIVRCESLIVKNLFTEDDISESIFGIMEIINLYNGILPIEQKRDNGSLGFAMNTIEQAIKTKAYEDAFVEGLEYEFLYSVMLIVI